MYYSCLRRRSRLRFGKYKGKTYDWIVNNDKDYAIWIYDNWNGDKDYLCYLSRHEIKERIVEIESKRYIKKNPNCGVYLIQQSFENNTYLKIGHSFNVFDRIKSHRCSNPFFNFIGYINTPDHKKLEKMLHKNCEHLKYRTEWFIYHSNIENFFKNHKLFKSGQLNEKEKQ